MNSQFPLLPNFSISQFRKISVFLEIDSCVRLAFGRNSFLFIRRISEGRSLSGKFSFLDDRLERQKCCFIRFGCAILGFVENQRQSLNFFVAPRRETFNNSFRKRTNNLNNFIIT